MKTEDANLFPGAMKLLLVTRRSIISTSVQLLVESRFNAVVISCADFRLLAVMLERDGPFDACIIGPTLGDWSADAIAASAQLYYPTLPSLIITSYFFPAAKDDLAGSPAQLNDNQLSDAIRKLVPAAIQQ